MSINIKVDADAAAAYKVLKKLEPQAKVFLRMRKLLDGSLIIFDHSDIDIVINGKKNKITSFPKDEFGDHIYASQSRLFDFLVKKGVVSHDSVRGGNVYGSLEGTIPDTDEVDTTQVAVFVISKFVEEERDHNKNSEEYEKEIEDYLFQPDDEDSTELGEVPHAQEKGGSGKWPGSAAAYALHGMYR